ncbi:FAD-binding oxidoreductase [Burkholderia sp. BCC1998]|uniref:NAD(P)/FAD-dependent oxidoreductase n=1 Tax=Burkholderia sp. BCC1998 TaxID=2817447 RepID=UPI002AB63F86|nr:FAD-binding oxidoreductase [Burkholderia sp. BCC1998]
MAANHYDVVVIGSGALGASVAFHLAQAGRSVALVDKAAIASQTSPRAAGLTGQVRRTEMMTHLAVRSVEKLTRFTQETGEPLVYYQAGSLTVARTPEHASMIRAGVQLGRHLGLDVDLVDVAAACELMPFMKPIDILAAGYMRTDLYLEPGQLPSGYARATHRLGGDLFPDTRVEQIVVQRGRIERVVTTRGEFRTANVVDAAGGWLRLVASFAGANLPAIPVRHQLMVTAPLEGVTNEQPTVRVLDANVYVRPDKGGLMFGGYESNPVMFDGNSLKPEQRVEDLALDPVVLHRLADSVCDQFPVFGDATIREYRGGLPTMTVDGDHILGPVPGVDGLFALGGCNVGGLSISPVLGELLADWIVTGKSSMELSRMAPARFLSDLPESDIVEQCRQKYANYYSASPAENVDPG